MMGTFVYINLIGNLKSQSTSWNLSGILVVVLQKGSSFVFSLVHILSITIVL